MGSLFVNLHLLVDGVPADVVQLDASIATDTTGLTATSTPRAT
jgi:hypothetical protein